MEKKWLILAVTVVLLVAVAVGSFLVFGKKRIIGSNTAFFPDLENEAAVEAAADAAPTRDPSVTPDVLGEISYGVLSAEDVESLRTQIEDLQKQHAAFLEAMEMTDKERETLREELNSVKAQLAQSAEEKAAWKEECQRLTDELEAAMQGGQTEQQGSADSEELNRKNAELEQQLAALNAEKAEREAALQAALSEQETLKSQIAALEEDQAGAKKAADEDLLNQLTAARENAEALNKQLETAAQENQTLRAEIETALAAAQEEAEALKAQATASSESIHGELVKVQQEKDELNEQLEKAQQEKDELNEQLAKAADTEKELTAEKEALQVDLTAAQTALATAQEEAEALKAQATASGESIHGELVKVRQEKDELNEQLEKAQQEKDALNEQLAKAADTEKELTAEKEALQADLAAAQNALATAQEEAEALNQQAAEAAQAQKTRLASVLREKQSLVLQLAKASRKETALTKEKETMQAELSAAQTALTAAQEETEALKAQATASSESLNGQLVMVQQEKDELNEQLAKAAENEKALTAEKEVLQADLTAAQAEAEEQKKQYAASVEALNSQLTEAKQEKEKLNEELTKAAETEKTLTGEKEALQADLTAAQTALAAAQEETEALKAKATASSESLNGQLVKVQQEKDALNEQLAKATETEKTLTAEKEALQADLTAAQAEADEQKKQYAASVEALNSQLLETKQEKEKLNEELTKAAETEKTLTAEKEGLQTELSAAHTALFAANQDAEEQKKQTAASIEALNGQLAKAQQEKDALNEKLLKAAETEKTLAGQLAAAAQEKETLSAQIVALKQDWADTQDKLTAETKKSDHLTKFLTKLLTSLSFAQDGEASLGERSMTDVLETMRQTMGLEKNAARSLGLPVEDGDSSGAAMTVNGEVVTKKEVDDALGVELLLHQYLQNGESPADREEIKDQMIRTLAENRVLWQQAESVGMTEITSEERQSMENTAARLESEYGLPENSVLSGLFASRVMDKLRESAGQDAAVSDEEYNQALEQKKRENRELMLNDPDAFARLLEGDHPRCYIIPNGYRLVKQIFIPAELGDYKRVQEEMKKADFLLKEADYALLLAYQNGTPDEIARKKQAKEDLEKTFAELQAEWTELEPRVTVQIQAAQQILSQINSSLTSKEVDVDDLIAQYSADKAMPASGYVIYANSKLPSPALAKAAMALYSEGVWSSAIEMEDGYHLLYYSKDFSKVNNYEEILAASRNLLREELTVAKQLEMAESTITGWLAKADIRMAK